MNTSTRMNEQRNEATTAVLMALGVVAFALGIVIGETAPQQYFPTGFGIAVGGAVLILLTPGVMQS